MSLDSFYLDEIITSCELIQVFIEEHDEESFILNSLLHSAVAYQLIIIGANARKLSETIRSFNENIAWDSIMAYKDISNGTPNVSWQTLWVIATVDIPEILYSTRDILKNIIKNN